MGWGWGGVEGLQCPHTQSEEDLQIIQVHLLDILSLSGKSAVNHQILLILYRVKVTSGTFLGGKSGRGFHGVGCTKHNCT